MLADLIAVRDVRDATKRLADPSEAVSILGPRWRSGEPDWSELERIVDWSAELRASLHILGGSTVAIDLIAAFIRTATSRESATKIKVASSNLCDAWKSWQRAWQDAEELLATSSVDAFGDPDAANWFGRVHSTTERWSQGLFELNNWCAWRTARNHAAAAGLEAFVRAYESNSIGRTELHDAFERGYGQAWFNGTADTVPFVRDFSAASHADRILKFGKLDAELTSLTHCLVRSRACRDLPDISVPSSAQSELGILKRELQLKSKRLPTRRLIESIPHILSKLKPCFLMSPLSVAQYLDARLPPFDLVVFDEASQIPVWDAIGAIARAKEVIVVGDSKQLPPTNFFNTVDGEADSDLDPTTVEDAQSILQECNASGIPSMLLRWHYRSQHESLIAFSNHHYYTNSLLTFPSPIDRSPELGVSFQHVPHGIYDRGDSCTNRVEADHVVQEVVRLLTESSTPDSVGVVTFNRAQQTLIEDLLDVKRRERPDLERHFAKDLAEPVFVKNLENVQGDERDTIIFSVGYGPDNTGKISMNFGPLNAEGGERRLNVAVTRARRRLKVFSSIRSDQLDLRRTASVGVAHFKTFLDYADRGPKAISEALTLPSSDSFDSGFEQAVCEELRQRGWSVDTQVGCAGYRVDLAVRDPSLPGRYLIGIECDGRCYHSAKTARDRDRLREAVLRSLGWKIARVWSTDWWINKSRCIEALQNQIKAAQQPPAVVKQSAPAHGAISAGASPSAPSKLIQSVSQQVQPAVRSAPSLPVYAAAKCPSTRIRNLDVYEPSSTIQSMKALASMVEQEGPIVEDLAIRRLAEWLGINRITDRFQRRVAEIRNAGIAKQLFRYEDGVFWPSGLQPNDFNDVRVPGEAPESFREIEHVPSPELINAVCLVVKQQVALPPEDLEREVGRVFGVNRVSAKNRELIRVALANTISLHRVVIRNGKLLLDR